MRKRSQFTSLREWREACGFSQREAARQFGVSQPGWAKIEALQRMPRRALAERIVRGTGLPMEVLMGISR